MKKTPQKTSKDDTAPWMKWAYVGIALIVAVAMVGTYLAPMFEKKPTAQVGNTAVIGYTIFSEDGRPLITTDQNLLASEYEKGNFVLLTYGLEMPVGAQVSGENIAPIPIAYPETNGTVGAGLLGFETNAISVGLVGMQAGETRTIPFSYGENDFEIDISEEEANEIGLNFTEAKVGEPFLREFMISSGITLGNETNQTPTLRFWKVTDKTDDSMAVTCRYGSARVTLNGITG
jgi:hypothetical protein